MARFLTRLAFALAAILIASVAFIAAVVFLFMALYLFFATLLISPLAALATAGVLIVFALMVLLIGRGFAAYRPARRASGARDEDPAAKYPNDPLAQFLGRELGGFALQSPYVAIATALAAGLLFGISPRLRGVILDLFRRRR